MDAEILSLNTKGHEESQRMESKAPVSFPKPIAVRTTEMMKASELDMVTPCCILGEKII